MTEKARRTIAVAGKGGTGKTTLSCFLVKRLLETGGGPILAIDADPSRNLGESLGVPAKETLGDIREETLENVRNLPVSMSKQEYLAIRVQEAIEEERGFDLLTMGRPEGPGCYCYVNNILRNTIDAISKNYGRVVIDCEAGLEHLSRRTARDVDVLLVVTDTSKKGAETAGAVLELMDSLKTRAGRKGLIFNRIPAEGGESIIEALRRGVKLEGFDFCGVLPEDRTVMEFDSQGESLLNFPADAPSYRTFVDLLPKIFNKSTQTANKLNHGLH